MTEKIIEVKNIAKRFGAFDAITDVSFNVYKGDVFGFLGPNGAGKSTTLRCMLSLITPDKGEILLFGKKIGSHRNEVLRRVGCIIEKPDFYKYLSAEKNLEIFARISGTTSSKKDIYKMLDFVGLSGREKDKVSGFSHGMKQRLGIAQTLLHQPDLIVLDEPTTGLDPQGIIDIRELILQLRKEHNKTVILSSHQLSEIEIIANRMVIINKGQSIIEGEVSQLLNSEELVAKIEVSNADMAIEVIAKKLTQIQIIHTDGNILHVVMERTQIPHLVDSICKEGIGIYSIESKRKLEDYFIKMVTN
jgi:ABC-2 type transport system ATP-binding protein